MIVQQKLAQARRTSDEIEVAPQSTKSKVLVVEDEQDLQELLRYNLERDGYRVTCVANGELAIKLVDTQSPDVIVLDLMLPGMDGLDVCRVLKSDAATAHIPIVILTAKGEEADIVTGLELGADDYVTKPFSPRVLLARLKALQRRKSGEDLDEDRKTTIRAGEMIIHVDRHQVILDGKTLEPTASEFRLLRLLANQPGRVYTRRQIVEKIHGDLAAVTDRSVDVLVMGLRRKLGEHGDHIQTVRGVGYRFKG